ncbi:response regulator [Herbaspirillum sp. NPDC087042]|uniref:response regulator n=1 Tax=Herbaspirillum sp. NPDC087042 TaxID=3364004 RepID=UPI00381F5965
MQAQRHILVVDDHPDICEPLAAYLRRQGLQVSMAFSAAQARALLQAQAFDLVVLDVMMPGEDGLSLCRHIGEHLGTPVILLTAMAASSDRVRGLDTGADDYVVKPFDPPELLARIRSVLRRLARQLTGPALAPAPVLSLPLPVRRYLFDTWTLDVERRELLDSAGASVTLSSVEYRLLRVLVEHPNTVLSRDRLLDLTAGTEALAFDRSIDSQVSRLRKKLESDPRKPSLLKTIWGNGYLLAAQVSTDASPS